MRNGLLAILGVGAVAIVVGSGAQAQPTKATTPRTVSVKLEWASTSPRGTDHITLAVDQGYTATASQGGRNVKVTSVVNPDNTVTINLRVNGPNAESLETEFTSQSGETKVVQAVRTMKGKDSTERLLFVTATPQG